MIEHPILEKIARFPMAQKFFEQTFENASRVFFDNCNVVTIKEDTKFVTAEENIDTIWILLLGQVKVLEEYVSGDEYIFTRFDALEVFGEMEGLAGIQKFRASLITETDCVFVTVPLSIYLTLLKKNNEILYKRTQSILNYVLKEGRNNRIYLKLSAEDRVKLYLKQHYDLENVDGKSIFKITRQQIANETRYSVKTINRVIKKLRDQGLLEVSGQKLVMTENQYICLLKSLEENLESSNSSKI